ncbi:hypothetical protein NBRC116188_14450 [Oceaniserpentilla sp. 4NH20-0058]
MAVQGVYSACLSSSGDRVLVGSIHHGGSYWQVDPVERLFDWNHKTDTKTGVLSCAISNNNQYASTAEHRKIVLWNAKTGEAFWLWEAPANIESMKLTQDGSFALLGMDNYEAALFDIQNGGVKFRLPHEGVVQTVDVSLNSKWGITGGDDSWVKVWDLSTGKSSFSWQLENQIKVVAISQDGSLGFAASHREDSIIWDLTNGQELLKLAQNNGFYTSARFNPEGTELLTGNSSGHVILWDVKVGQIIKRWQLSPRSGWVNKKTQVLDVAFAPTGYKAVGANGITYELN